MIRSYAFILPTERPTDAVTTLLTDLVEAGVSMVEVTLHRVDVDGYTMRITAEESEANLGLLLDLFGTVNTRSEALAMMAAAGDFGQRGNGYDVMGGGEGRFAAENRPAL